MKNISLRAAFYFQVISEVDRELRERFSEENLGATHAEKIQHLDDFAFALCLMASATLTAIKESSTQTALNGLQGPELAEAAIEAIQRVIDERFKAHQERN